MSDTYIQKYKTQLLLTLLTAVIGTALVVMLGIYFWDDITGNVVLYSLVKIIVIVVPLLLGVAYLTYAERKIIGYMQVRVGPNRVGPRGWLQPAARTNAVGTDSYLHVADYLALGEGEIGHGKQ